MSKKGSGKGGDDGVSMHPALHPDHNSSDLSHLRPHLLKELYYSQEGHRPAMHGAKHAQVMATFDHPTVVLDHSSHLKSVSCDNNKLVTICFQSTEAMRMAEESWQSLDKGIFNLVTYHPGCGDTTGTRRTFFEASMPLFDQSSACAIVPVTRRREQDSLRAGDVSFGTYVSPSIRKRQDAEGHVRVSSPALPTRPERIGNMTYSDTVDLTQNAWAVKEFFNTTEINTDIPDGPVKDGPDFISSNGTVYKRAEIHSNHELARWIKQGAQWVIKKVLLYCSGKNAGDVGYMLKFVVDHATYSLADFKKSTRHGFHPEYKRDFNITAFPKQDPENKPPKIHGVDDGFALTRPFVWGGIQCAKCGIVSEFTLAAAFSFELTKGITRGEISLISKRDLDLYAIFGFSIHGQVPKEFTKLKKEIISHTFSPINIPGIFELGPKVILQAAATMEIVGRGDFLVGGQVHMTPGKATVNLTDPKGSEWEGLEPSFIPVAESDSVKGASLSITMDLGVPFILECGLDVLNGLFKKSVAVVNTPSIFVTATASNRPSDPCNGDLLSVGAKNKFHVGLFDRLEYTVKEWVLRSDIYCLGKRRTQTPKGTEETKKLQSEVEKHFGGKENLLPEKTPQLEDISLDLTSGSDSEGFQIVMDADRTSILVSGDDGFLYFVNKDDHYDLSAPWGTINTTTNVITFDVFGRLLNYDHEEWASIGNGKVAPVRLNAPENIPVIRNRYRPIMHRSALALAPLRPNNEHQGEDSYAIARIKRFPGKTYYATHFNYPTACLIPDQGLRLFLTLLPVGRDGKVRELQNSKQEREWEIAFQNVGATQSNRRTVRLISESSGQSVNNN